MPSSWSGFSRRSTLKNESSNLTPKKVVHIITRLDHGGSARETLQTVLGHDRGRFRVSIAFGRPETTTADDAALLKTDLQQLGQADVSVFQVPPLVREINPVLDAWATVALWRLLRGVRPDVVHTHTSKAGAVGRLAAWLAGIPVVIHTPHGHLFYGYYGRFLSTLLCFAERLLARLTDRIVTLTDRGAQEHVQYKIASPQKVVTIHGGNSLAQFRSMRVNATVKRKKLELPLEGPIIGTVGRLVPIKGHSWLLRAVLRVLAEFPQACVVLIGDGPLLGELQELASELGISQHVVFLGTRHDVPECPAALGLFGLPSLHEGMGRALVEAMAVGCPVVATRVGGIPDIVDDGVTGLLIPARDA